MFTQRLHILERQGKGWWIKKKKKKVGGNSEQCSLISKSFRENIKQENIEQEREG